LQAKLPLRRSPGSPARLYSSLVPVKDCDDDVSRIGVQDTQLVLIHKDGTVDLIPLGNRKMSDVVLQLHTKYGDDLDRIETN
jgi:hypothetical protein